MRRKAKRIWACLLALLLLFSVAGESGFPVFAEEESKAERSELSEETEAEEEKEPEQEKMTQGENGTENPSSEAKPEQPEPEQPGQAAEPEAGPEQNQENPAKEPEQQFEAQSEEGYRVLVTAQAGILPAEAVLKAAKLPEESAAYAEAARAVEAAGTEFDGMLALDIHFEKDGAEVEPEGPVSVSVEIPELLPADVEVESLKVSHVLEENGTVQAKPVASTDEATAGSAELQSREEAQDLKVDFVTESFSSYTITWQVKGSGQNEPVRKIQLPLYAATEADDETYQELAGVTKKLGNLPVYTDGTGEVKIPTNVPEVKVGEKIYTFSGEAYLEVDGSYHKVTGLKFRSFSFSTGWWGQYVTWYVVYAVGEGLDEPTADTYQNAANVLFYGKVTSNGFENNGVYTEHKVYLDYNTPADPLNPGTGGGGGSMPTLEKSKRAVRREDGTYDLTLEIKGKAETKSEKRKLDVLLIVDESGSMQDGMDGTEGVGYRSSRWYNSKVAIQSLIHTLEENKGLDVRYSIVTYSGNDSSYGSHDSPFDDARVCMDWGDVKDVHISASFDDQNANFETGEGDLDYTPEGGTNYQAGLRTAAAQLAYARQDASKVVIFLSDGYPTFFYNEKGMTRGDGQNDAYGNDSHACSNAAYPQAAELTGVQYFYTIGLGNEGNINATTLTTISSKVAGANKNLGITTVTNTDNKPFLCTDLTALKDAFAKMAANITRMACTKVEVSDELSENVVLLNKAGQELTGLTAEDYTLYAKDETGTAQDVPEGTKVSYANGALSVKFPEDYELKDSWSYGITVRIRPSDKAYEDYLSGKETYPDTGAEDTGTHSGEAGFYSNKEAKVTYLWNKSADRTELFPMPVVQVRTSELSVEKRIEGNMRNPKDIFAFKLTLQKNGKDYPGELSGLKKETDGSYSFSLKGGEKAVFTLPWGYTYTVTETDSKGYRAFVTVDKEEEVEKTGCIGNTNGDHSLVFRNYKNVMVPTGVAESEKAPLYRMLAAMGMSMGVVLWISMRRKRR